MKLRQNPYREGVPLSEHTTLKIGGPAKFFIKVSTLDSLKKSINHANKNSLKFLVIGSGSNLLISDNGLDGMVIKNCASGAVVSDNMISVLSGTLLENLVNTANKAGLTGLEKLAGIPGTVGGAIYGNAGAYGQSISDRLTKVRVFDGDQDYWINRSDCGFGYRDSKFKGRNLTILEAKFSLEKADPKSLAQISDKIRKVRNEKYPRGTRCPGSFFKNVITQNLPEESLKKIPSDKIIHGKIPAGYLLEMVGAKGAKKGNIKIADYHANLIINEGSGTAADFLLLVKEYQQKVKEKFGITLEPEVQLV